LPSDVCKLVVRGIIETDDTVREVKLFDVRGMGRIAPETTCAFLRRRVQLSFKGHVAIVVPHDFALTSEGLDLLSQDGVTAVVGLVLTNGDDTVRAASALAQGRNIAKVTVWTHPGHAGEINTAFSGHGFALECPPSFSAHSPMMAAAFVRHQNNKDRDHCAGAQTSHAANPCALSQSVDTRSCSSSVLPQSVVPVSSSSSSALPPAVAPVSSSSSSSAAVPRATPGTGKARAVAQTNAAAPDQHQQQHHHLLHHTAPGSSSSSSSSSASTQAKRKRPESDQAGPIDVARSINFTDAAPAPAIEPPAASSSSASGTGRSVESGNRSLAADRSGNGSLAADRSGNRWLASDDSDGDDDDDAELLGDDTSSESGDAGGVIDTSAPLTSPTDRVFVDYFKGLHNAGIFDTDGNLYTVEGRAKPVRKQEILPWLKHTKNGLGIAKKICHRLMGKFRKRLIQKRTQYRFATSRAGATAKFQEILPSAGIRPADLEADMAAHAYVRSEMGFKLPSDNYWMVYPRKLSEIDRHLAGNSGADSD
jgi:hypothetical protein